MTEKRSKKALILAGGGMKVAYQAGVMQVWMDEAGLSFDLADGCSGGCLNLAMYCQDMTGTEIADNWRHYNPLGAIEFNFKEYTKLFYAESLFDLDRFRDKVLGNWKLDWNAIRQSEYQATFNAYNFSKHELATWTPDQMTEDKLISCISLPMWFPPVQMEGQTYIDSVFITDANIEEAIARGADELWIIWTVSTLDEYHNGFVNHYFQIIETSANGHFRRILKRIEKNNEAIASGQAGEFGRPIKVNLLESEVSMHYLINFSKDRVHEAVNAGVQDARKWCRERNIPLSQVQQDVAAEIHHAHTSLCFTEVMKGFVWHGAGDYDQAYRRGREEGNSLKFRLTIDVQGVNRFVTQPDHSATATGYVEGRAVGGRAGVKKGTFNLFTDQGDPRQKIMLYRLFVENEHGDKYTLSGYKDIRNDPGFDIWDDTTTLFTILYDGHVETANEDMALPIATGILRIHLTDFIKQMTTFQTEGPTLNDRTAAMSRFGKLFLGNLWEVYARLLLN